MRHFRRAYYPTRRTAYGPRDGRAHRYVEDAETGAGAAPARSARELATLPDTQALGLRFAEIAMPRSGVRLVVACPDCGRRCARLYQGCSPFWGWVCRKCAGLVYWRQYAGRRAEADEARLLASVGRFRGWQDALDTWREREAQHDARAWAALTINRLRLDQMIAYHDWLDEVNAALARGVSYRTAQRESQHTATILQLEQRIRALASERRQRQAA